jgi:acetyl esterase/lipase
MGTMSEKIPSVEAFEEKKDTEVLPGLVIKADGTVVRNSDRTQPTTNTMVTSSPVFVNSVASKDLVFDSETGIWGRVFLPESVTGGLSKKLPVVVYFHGGGFCMGDAGNGLVPNCFLCHLSFPPS